MSRDFTLFAVKRQLDAFGCERYEVGIIDGHDEEAKMDLREMSNSQIIKSVPYFKKRNVDGCHIFIRPKGSQGLVFFDDLNRKTIDFLESDGLSPAVLIESSPLNYQGWVRVSDNPISTELATAASKVIANKYDGDTGAAAWRQFGRLAGFTNQKPHHVDEFGKYPFVKIRGSSGLLCESNCEILDEAETYLHEKEIENKARLDSLRESLDNPTIDDNDQAVIFFSSELRGIIKRYGEKTNASQADWMIVNNMLTKGFSVDSIKYSLSCESLKATRTGVNPDKYIAETISKAIGIKV